MKKGGILATVITAISCSVAMSGCNKLIGPSEYKYATIDINGHVVLFENVVPDYDNYQNVFGKTAEGNKIFLTGAQLYTNKPDKKYYEYTSEEWEKHECSAEEDYRCPQHKHDDDHCK